MARNHLRQWALWVSVIGCSVLNGNNAYAGGFRNVVNNRFATVSNGPQNAVIVDVTDPADRTAVAAAVTRKLRETRGPALSALVEQYQFLQQHPPFRHEAGRLAPFTFDDVVILRTGGRLVRTASTGVRALAFTGGDLTFTFEGWGAQEQDTLQRFTGQAYAAAVAVYGSPATSASVRIVKDANVPSAQRNGGGFYNASIHEIHLHPTVDYLTNREEVHLNLLHLILHAFHGDAQLQYDAWEEGFARAATIAALGFIDASAEVPKTGAEITRFSQYYLMQLYDALNQPALAGSRFLSASGWDGMLLWRNAMATAAWLKVYAEKRDFFLQFNQSYYAQFTPELAGNVPGLKGIAAAVLGDRVEGRSFDDWYRRQYVLDTSVVPGEKLFVYNAPVFPTQAAPPSDSGYSQAAILQYFRTDGASGSETPLNGTCYPVAWGFDYAQELPLEAQDRRATIVNGQATVIPTFFNIGSTTAQRVTIDYTVGAETVRTFLPVTFTGVEPSWNDFLGVFLGANAGTVQVTLQSGASDTQSAVQGAFGTRLAAGELPAFSRTTVSYTANVGGTPQTITQQINTGFDYYLAVLPVGAALPRNVSQAIPAGIQLLTAPIASFLNDPAGNFGLTANQLLLARWDPTLVTENRYQSFPLSPPWRPGRAFWVKLDAPRTLSIDGTPPLPDADAPIGVPFGWSQIGNPWLEARSTANIRVRFQDRDMVPFSTAVTNGWIQQGLWRFVPGVGYQTSGTLPPWEGVWIRVNVPDGLTLYVLPPGVAAQSVIRTAAREVAPVVPGTATTPRLRRPYITTAPAASTPVSGWRLDLSTLGGEGTARVTIGQAVGAGDGYDGGMDVERPPSPRMQGAAPAAELSAVVGPAPIGASSEGRPALAADIRGFATKPSWLLELRTSSPGAPATLQLAASGRMPAGLMLRDVSTGHVFRVDRTRSLSVRTDGTGIARLQVVGEVPETPVTVTPLQLLPAGPGKVRFGFATGADAEIEVRVFGRWSELVQPLFRGLLPAGRYELEWDGRNERGAAPPGLYRIVVTVRAGRRQAAADLRARLAR